MKATFLNTVSVYFLIPYILRVSSLPTTVCYDSGGTAYQVGESVPPNEGSSCTSCICQEDGIVNCTANSCPVLQCSVSKRVLPEGECCYECEAGAPNVCFFDGQEFAIGETVPSPEGYECYDCTCNSDGGISCFWYCPSFQCAEELITQEEGDCCPTCNPGCGYNGVAYDYGESVPPNEGSSCTSCICQEGGIVSCTANSCPVLQCSVSKRVLPEGECCYECEAGAPNVCFFDGQEYAIGETVPSPEGYECYNCTCNSDGGISCFWYCPSFQCAEELITQEEGDCCPTCNPGCGYNGVAYEYGESVPPNEGSSCTSCICQEDGIVSCTANSCPLLQCSMSKRVLPEGECCYECEAEAPNVCFLDGQEFAIGESVPPNDGSSCTSCICQEDGIISCTASSCPLLQCSMSKRVLPEGECCYECEAGAPDVCFLDGQEFAIGESVPPNEGSSCTSCICQEDGIVNCTADSCPVLQCSVSKRVLLEGECCYECEAGAPNVCFFDGQEFAIGESVPPNEGSSCTSCICQEDGIVSCTANSCPLLQCSMSKRILPEGECCYECEAGAPNVCFLDGQEYAIGESVPPNEGSSCTSCICQEDGIISCTASSCPLLQCSMSKRVLPEGECCYECEAGAPDVCFLDGQEFAIGESVPPNEGSSCTSCICQEDGIVNCTADSCPVLQCSVSKRVLPEGECCYECEAGAPNVCFFDGQEYAIGATLPPEVLSQFDQCYQSCTCEGDGSFSCLPC